MKPRDFKSEFFTARGACVVVDGQKVVDVSIDVYDDRASAGEFLRYGQWMIKAAKWLKETASVARDDNR